MRICIKQVGAVLPIMTGTRPNALLHVCYDDRLVHKSAMKRDRLPYRVALPHEMQRILDMDRRDPIERRPKRLVLGPINREPYHFYSLRLPYGGLHLPHGELCGHLSLVLWVELYDPVFPYQVLFHIKGSDPVIHPFGNRVLWKAHRHSTPTSSLSCPAQSAGGTGVWVWGKGYVAVLRRRTPTT